MDDEQDREVSGCSVFQLLFHFLIERNPSSYEGKIIRSKVFDKKIPFKLEKEEKEEKKISGIERFFFFHLSGEFSINHLLCAVQVST